MNMNTYFWTILQGHKIYHDVNVEDSQPVKQHPHRMNPIKQKYL